MQIRSGTIAVVFFLGIGLPLRLEAQSTPAPQPATTPRSLSLPLSFEQTTEQSKQPQFVARGRRGTLALQKNGALVVLPGHETGEHVLRMTFAGGNHESRMSGEEELAGKVYYASRDFIGPLIGRSTFGRVRYSGLYRGIDAVFYGNDGKLEFDFEVAPHASPDQIRLSLAGADQIALEPSGDLSVRAAGQEVRLKKPVIYQERDGVRIPISGGYRLTRRQSELQFEVGRYDRNLPLIIDPTILFATYFGGAGNEFIFRNGWVRANVAGETYLFGDSTQSSSLPPHQTFTIVAQPATQECFLTKLAADGNAALYTVVFAGAQCQAMDIGSGKVHLSVGGAGPTVVATLNESTMTLGPLQGSYAVDPATHPTFSVLWMRADSHGNVYLIVVSGPGSSIVYELQKVDAHGQLLGKMQVLLTNLVNGAAPDAVQDFDVDDAGHAYVVGTVKTPGVVIPTPNAYQSSLPSKQSPQYNTGFLRRVNTSTPNAFQIDYSTFIGGSRDDYTVAVAFDPSSNDVVVAGTSNSADFPNTPGSYASYDTSNNQDEAFLLKFDPGRASTQQLVYGTFLDPASSAQALTILPGGLPVIGGTARDSSAALGDTPFPLVNSLYPAQSKYSNRPFLTVFSPDASSLLFSTFLDPATSSQSFNPVLATNGSTLYEAITSNVPGISAGNAFQPGLAGGYDVFLRTLDASDLVSAALGADLSLTATATPNPVEVADLLTYSATITNPGSQTATGVTLDFLLPATVNFESAATGQGSCNVPAAGSTGDVNCNLGTLAAGAIAQLTISVRPQAAGALAATLTVTSTSHDPSLSNNVVTLTTTVNSNQGPAIVTVAETIVVTDTVLIQPSAWISFPENIKLTDAPTPLPSFLIPVSENIAVRDMPSVVPQQPGIFVPVGGAIVVHLVDASGNPLPIELTFSSVVREGVALGNVVSLPPSPPGGFRFLGSVFDITTTASYTGPVIVCFLGSHFLAQDQLWHAGTLIGSSVNTVTKVCALADSLSPFGVVEPSYQFTLLYDPGVAKKSGSAYPIKIQLSDIAGNNLSSSSIVVHAVGVTAVSSNTPGTLDDTGNANPDFDFRYDSSLSGYIFNLSTKGFATGTYTLDFIAGLDPQKHSAVFAVK